jgi:hypothetical protein
MLSRPTPSLGKQGGVALAYGGMTAIMPGGWEL